MHTFAGLLLLAWFPLAQAAGIDCGRAATEVDRLICADPVLRAQDAALAKAWERALAVTQYRQALIADQREWLDRRLQAGENADEKIRWLRFKYAIRLAELHPQAIGGRFEWRSRWVQTDPPGYSGDLSIRTDGPHRIWTEFEATGRGNGGSLIAPATIDGDLATIAALSFAPGCLVTLRRMQRQLEVDQAGHCGEGSGVHFSGRYFPAAGRVAPDWNLLTLGLVREPADDDTIRRAMGADAYARMIETIDTRWPMAANMGTVLIELGRRGNDQAMLLQRDRKFWILVSFEGDEGLRYYTNDTASVAEPPHDFDGLRQRRAYPIHLMSAPGQPVLAAAHDVR